mmetsp:Transcript_96388/g.272935  ORF Transcript_96388/g.272935 Transcript_96388/m.272935 type:complete len:203 (+) Transcript_96388:103-711(+)
MAMITFILALAAVSPARGIAVSLTKLNITRYEGGVLKEVQPRAYGNYAYPGMYGQAYGQRYGQRHLKAPEMNICRQKGCQVKRADLSAATAKAGRGVDFKAHANVSGKIPQLFAKYQLWLGSWLVRETVFGCCGTNHWAVPMFFDITMTAPHCPINPGAVDLGVDIHLGTFLPAGTYSYQIILSDEYDAGRCVACVHASFDL